MSELVQRLAIIVHDRAGLDATCDDIVQVLEREVGLACGVGNAGMAKPKPLGGDRLSRRTEAHAGLIHASLADMPDITLPELKARLAGQGAHVSVAALWRFCCCHKITRKKRRRTRPSRSGPML